ncbi:MAG TPA: hypothetical protein VFW86_04765, partial [Candidatus Limnocylindrales bacterium]|nr:hypothetical protein [Candidatus Limnocylindrales bacterium]
LLAGPISAAAGEGIAVIDSATATASALAALLEANGLQSAAADPPIHLQLTTGDVERFRWTARHLFGDLFPAVEPIRLPGQAVPVQPVAS